MNDACNGYLVRESINLHYSYQLPIAVQKLPKMNNLQWEIRLFYWDQHIHIYFRVLFYVI